jgi:DNA-binding protein WhiA
VSFSSQVKKNLCALPFESEGCLRAELSGMLAPGAIVTTDGMGIPVTLAFHSENPAVIGRCYRLVKALYSQKPTVTIREARQFRSHRSYALSIDREVERVLKDLRLLRHNAADQRFYSNGVPAFFKSKQRFVKSYLRGVFLACGTISDPEKGYRLEMACRHEDYLRSVAEVLGQYDIKSGKTTRKSHVVLYMKEAESVTAFLGLIGAHKALLELENIRVVREVRNGVNRRVNFELANVDKTNTAAQTQLATIREIQKTMGLDALPESLGRLAQLRLDNPEVSLKELGEMMEPPISKSGVYHRFAKMAKLCGERKNGHD